MHNRQVCQQNTIRDPDAGQSPVSGLGRLRYRLWLWLFCGVLSAAAQPKQVVIFGERESSTTEPSPAFPQRVRQELAAAGFAVEVSDARSRGTSMIGAPARQGPVLERFAATVRQHHPDIAVLQLGIHDSWVDEGGPSAPSRTPLAQFSANLSFMVNSLTEDKVRVVLMTPHPIDGLAEWRQQRLAQYAAAVRNVATQFSLPVADVWQAFRQYDQQEGRHLGELFQDQWTLGPTGQGRVAQLLTKAILELYPSAVAPARQTVPVVADGEARAADFDVEPWPADEHGLLVGVGHDNGLRVRLRLAPGKLDVHAVLALDRLDGTAAAFVLNGSSYIGFDDRQGRVFARGPLFGKEPEQFGAARDYLQPEAPATVDLHQEDGRISLRIDGREAASLAVQEPIASLGLLPGRARIRLRELTVTGPLQALPALPAPSNELLPRLDLTDEKGTHVSVERETVQYIGHPTTQLLPDGKTVFTVATRGHGRGRLLLRRSSDMGQSWTERMVVPNNWTVEDSPTLHAVTWRDADGEQHHRLLLLAGTPHGEGGFESAHLELAKTGGYDPKQAWTELQDHFAGQRVFPCLAGSSLIRTRARLPNGRFFRDARGNWVMADRWLMLFHNSWGQNWKCTLAFDETGEAQWTAPEQYLRGLTEHAMLSEPCAIRSPDGGQIAVIFRAARGHVNSMVTTSSDEGESWSHPQRLADALTGARHQAAYDPLSGRLVITFRDRRVGAEGAPSGDWLVWVGHYADLLNGSAGQYQVRLRANARPNEGGYGGIEVVDDPANADFGTFLFTAYGQWDPEAPPYVSCYRSTLAEFDRKLGLERHDVDVFRAGADGAAQYRMPALAVAPDGAVIAVCDARVERPGEAPNNIDLVLRRSQDHGKTWGAIRTIVDFPGQEAATFASLTPDRDTGTLWLCYAQCPPSVGVYASHPGFGNDTVHLHLRHSVDGGRTWSAARDLTETVRPPAWPAMWPSPGCGIHRPDGTLLIPVCAWHAPGEGYSHLLSSADRGKTWELLPAPGSGVTESQVAELSDGSLLLSMRALQGDGGRRVSRSGDGGRTWSKIVSVPELPDPVCQASLVRYTSVKAGDDRDRLLFVNPAGSGRERLTVRLSYDDGATWPVAKVLHAGPSAYSCVVILRDHSVGVLYECGDNGPYQRLRFTRFTLAWLTDARDGIGAAAEPQPAAGQ